MLQQRRGFVGYFLAHSGVYDLCPLSTLQRLQCPGRNWIHLHRPLLLQSAAVAGAREHGGFTDGSRTLVGGASPLPDDRPFVDRVGDRQRNRGVYPPARGAPQGGKKSAYGTKKTLARHDEHPF